MARTQEQTEALEQLWAITSSESVAAREHDERLLRENGWDIQRTVEQIFSTDHAKPVNSGPSQPSSSSKGELESSSSGLPKSSGGRGTAGRPTSAGLGIWQTITRPFSFLLSITVGTWYLLIRTFVPLSFLPYLPRFLLPPPSRIAPNGPRDPTTATLRFVRDIEMLTGCSTAAGTLPDLWVGPYREFLSVVRKQGKVGLVVILCGEHEDDEEFKREVLADSEFIKCIKEHDIMIWAADVRSREGYMVSQTLLTTTYPSLTFTSLLPAQNSTVPRLTILTTLSGPPSTTTSASALIQTITTSILPRTSAFLNRLRRERLALEEARHLREEQDRAFHEAERKDREILEQARKEEALRKVQLERAERQAAAAAKRVDDRRVWRRYARKHLLPPSGGPIRVVIRTPLNANRNLRQFEPGPSTLPLFIYAETLLIPETERPEDDPDTPPEGYEHEWGFSLVSAFPRQEIEVTEEGAENVWSLVKSSGGALFAEKRPRSDWGDAELRATNEDSDEEVLSE